MIPAWRASNGGTLHDFDPGAGVDTMQQITLQAGGSIDITLQWDQPFGSLGGSGSASDVDLLVYDSAGNVVTTLSSINNNIGGDAVEITEIDNTASATAVTYSIGFELVSGPAPGDCEICHAFGGGFSIDEFATNSSTSFGHANAQGAEAVGAARVRLTPRTSANRRRSWSRSPRPAGSTFCSTRAATGCKPPVIRQTPDIVAPDGANTTFFPLPSRPRTISKATASPTSSAPPRRRRMRRPWPR